MQTGDIELLFVDPSIVIFVEDLEPVANDHIPGEMTSKPGAKKMLRKMCGGHLARAIPKK